MLFAIALIILGNLLYYRQSDLYDPQLMVAVDARENVGRVTSFAENKNGKYQAKVFIPDIKNSIILESSLDDFLKPGYVVKFDCPQYSKKKMDETFARYLIKEKAIGKCPARQVDLVSRDHQNFFLEGVGQIRSYCLRLINRTVSEPEGSFLAGLLIGGSQGLPEAVTEDFKRTGTTHLIAVSGFNVSLLINLVLAVFTAVYYSRRKTFIVLSVFLCGYVVITGAGASVIRAALMAWILLLSKTIGRYVNIRNLLLLTALIMVLYNPFILRYDIGFQLSFIATIALIYISPQLQSVFRLDEIKIKYLPAILGEYILPSIVAYVMTLPLIIHYFGLLSLIAPLANILAAPLIPLSSFAGIAHLVLFSHLPVLREVSGFGIWLVLHAILALLHQFAGISWASIELPKLNGIFTAGFYGLAYLFSKYIKRRHDQI